MFAAAFFYILPHVEYYGIIVGRGIELNVEADSEVEDLRFSVYNGASELEEMAYVFCSHKHHCTEILQSDAIVLNEDNGITPSYFASLMTTPRTTQYVRIFEKNVPITVLRLEKNKMPFEDMIIKKELTLNEDKKPE